MSTPGDAATTQRRHLTKGKIIAFVFGIVIVVAIFAFAIPRHANYSAVWAAMKTLTPIEFWSLMAATVPLPHVLAGEPGGADRHGHRGGSKPGSSESSWSGRPHRVRSLGPGVGDTFKFTANPDVSNVQPFLPATPLGHPAGPRAAARSQSPRV